MKKCTRRSFLKKSALVGAAFVGMPFLACPAEGPGAKGKKERLAMKAARNPYL